MTQGKYVELSVAPRADVWRRWKTGESLHTIGRAFDRPHTFTVCWRITVGLFRRFVGVGLALDMRCPAEVYTPATRHYRGLPELAYPFHDRTIHVTNCGRICLQRKKINLSTVFAGQAVGLKEVEEGIWLVSFMEYDLGYIDLQEKTLQPLDNPFGPKVLPM